MPKKVNAPEPIFEGEVTGGELVKARTGRPSIFSAELAHEICERLAVGETLISICLDDHMPGETTVYRWLASMPEFRDNYSQAREVQADHEFDRASNIAYQATVENFQVARLQIDTIKWRAAHLRPKKYGPRMEMGVEGTLGLDVVNHTSRDRAKAMAALLAKQKSE